MRDRLIRELQSSDCGVVTDEIKSNASEVVNALVRLAKRGDAPDRLGAIKFIFEVVDGPKPAANTIAEFRPSTPPYCPPPASPHWPAPAPWQLTVPLGNCYTANAPTPPYHKVDETAKPNGSPFDSAHYPR